MLYDKIKYLSFTVAYEIFTIQFFFYTLIFIAD